MSGVSRGGRSACEAEGRLWIGSGASLERLRRGSGERQINPFVLGSWRGTPKSFVLATRAQQNIFVLTTPSPSPINPPTHHTPTNPRTPTTHRTALQLQGVMHGRDSPHCLLQFWGGWVGWVGE